jgi:hypothetical protein
VQLPLYRYWRISVSTLEVDIAAIKKEGRRSTSVHSFVTANKQMKRQSVRRVISYRFAMRTVLGSYGLGFAIGTCRRQEICLHILNLSSRPSFSRVVNRKRWPPRTREHAMYFKSRRLVCEHFRRFQVCRGRSIRHIDGYVLFQLNLIRAQKRDC